jgi:hypothetical protein
MEQFTFELLKRDDVVSFAACATYLSANQQRIRAGDGVRC